MIPGRPGPKLKRAIDSMSPERRAAFEQHLAGGTPATYLSDWLGRAGTPVSATTIKEYRATTKGA